MSEYQAVLALKPAWHYTIDQFWPPKAGHILRLLLISFFIGTWIANPFPQDLSLSDITTLSPQITGGVLPGETNQIIAVMIGILLVLLIYALFSSIFQFIFVDYLSLKSEKILPSFQARAGMGMRLLGFYLVTIFLIGLCAAVVIIGIAVPVLLTHPYEPSRFFVALLYTLAGLLILIIPIWILTIIVTDFVVPVMIVHECGIIQGGRIIWKEFSGKWDETGMYLLFKMGINIGTGIILGIFLVAAMEMMGFSSLTLIPGMGSAFQVSFSEMFIPLLLMAGITLVVMTPVTTFLRYYALIFLELLSETYDLLPELKEKMISSTP